MNEIVPVERLNRPHISFSEWQNFRSNCQNRWFLDYVEGMRLNDESIDLKFGTCIHKACEGIFHPVLEERPSLEQAIELFTAHFNTECEDLMTKGAMNYGPWHQKLHAGKHPLEMVEAGKRILEDLTKVPELQGATVIKIEYQVDDEFQRTDYPLRFKGFIDIIFTVKNKNNQTVLYICDFKTCKWGWSKDKKEDPNVTGQLLLYKHFVCKKLDVNPKMVRACFILLKKTPRPNDTTVELVQVNSSENQIRSIVAALQTDVTRMRLGAREKNRDNCVKPWGCCPHYDTPACPGKVAQVEKKLR